MPAIPMLKENNVRRGFVEDSDFARLAAEASELWLRAFLELAFTYGWRRGELLGLRVGQTNLALGTIRLDPGTTKNCDGREVAMTAKVAELLREAIHGKKSDDFVLTRKGKPVLDFRGQWRNLCERAGLGGFVCRSCEQPVTAQKCACGSRKRTYRGLIPHDMRRSAAEAARRAGVPESVVMAMGGWRTAAMFRRYAIVSSADQRAAVEMLERACSEQASGSAPFSAPFSNKAAEGRIAKVQ
jgi:integrase